MTLDLQFRLPSGMALPPSQEDVHIEASEGGQHAYVSVGRDWHGHDGDRAVILATASLTGKTNSRIVSLSLPGISKQTWRLALSSDPDPTPDFTAWRLADNSTDPKIELNYCLRADR